MERGEARGDGTDRTAHLQGGADWAYVGDAPGSIFSVFTWYRRLMQFYFGARSPTAPFFVARDRARPYTYTAAMSDLHEMLRRVGDDLEYGLHGLRVEGFNSFREECGEELAVVQGGWKPGSEARYARFDVGEVIAGAAHVAGVANPYRADRRRPAPREVQRVRPVRHGDQRARDDSALATRAPPAHDGADVHGAAGAIFVTAPPAAVPAAVPVVRRTDTAQVADALFGARRTAPVAPATVLPVAAATPLPLPVLSPRPVIPNPNPNTAPSPFQLPPPPPPQQRRSPSPTLPPLERRVTRAMAQEP